jgi:putative oxidoreductase
MTNIGSTCVREWGVTILRVCVGLMFAMHGGQKWFVYGIDNVAANFGKGGLPAPMLSAVLSSGAEFGCGILLVVGLLTRWATIPLIINMLVALLAVHLKNGFFLPTGFEYVFILLGCLTAILLLGSGPLAIDQLLPGRARACPTPSTVA